MNHSASGSAASRSHATAGRSVALTSVRTRRTAGARGHGVPLTFGFCSPRGFIAESAGTGAQVVLAAGDTPEGRDCASPAVLRNAAGNSAPARLRVLNRWPDGSARWLLTDAVLPESGSAEGEIEHWTLHADRETVSEYRPPSSLKTIKDEILLTMPAVPEVGADRHTVGLRLTLTDENGNPVSLTVTGTEITAAGPVRHDAVVRYRVNDAPSVQLLMRIVVWSSTQTAEVSVRIRNMRRAAHSGGLWDLGDSGSFHFRGLHLHGELRGDDTNRAGIADHAAWQAEAEGRVRLLPWSDGRTFRILQRGSGGINWKSGGHVDRNKRSTVSDRGYAVHSPVGTLRGYRSEPLVTLFHGDSLFAAAVPEFWQQFPGSISTDGAGINVGLFPTEDRQVFELQGGEQKTLSAVFRTGSLSGRDRAECTQILSWVRNRPAALADVETLVSSGAVDWFQADDSAETETQQRYREWLSGVVRGNRSLQGRRESADEYGWRSFGDIHACHEQRHFTGFRTIVSHYNNQFDSVCGFLLHWLRSGDQEWFSAADALARHVADIDIYHTTEDRAAFNGGLFWHTDHYVDAATCTHRTYSAANAEGRESYGGGPSDEHNYTTGLLYHHFLTGNPESRDAVISLADWVIAMDDGTRTVLGVLDSGPTGLASATYVPDYHGPGRGSGNSINALTDAWILTSNRRYADKAAELMRRVTHPSQDCDALCLTDSEGHWSYTVCLLAVARFLHAKRLNDEVDSDYQYAREVLAHYGSWMADREKTALSVPEELEYPTETWAAQDIRKVNVMRIGACCHDDPEEADRIRTRAAEISRDAWDQLQSFGDAQFNARCMAILLTEGLREIWHTSGTPTVVPPSGVSADAPQGWTMFVPQKQRVRQLLKRPWQAALVLPRLLNPAGCVRSLKALRRRF